MYSTHPQFVIGFHGCDESTAINVISNKELLRKSENVYDWLGHGLYFWENNYKRALDFAKEMKKINRPGKAPIKKPAVIGAIIDLGFCLNLLETGSLQIVKAAYDMLVETQRKAGYELPVNKPLRTGTDLIFRHLDCAVIENIHTYNSQQGKPGYDTIRGVFFEGNDLYLNADFKEKNHIQICVRNPNCIKGYFHPRDLDSQYNRP